MELTGDRGFSYLKSDRGFWFVSCFWDVRLLILRKNSWSGCCSGWWDPDHLRRTLWPQLFFFSSFGWQRNLLSLPPTWRKQKSRKTLPHSLYQLSSIIYLKSPDDIGRQAKKPKDTKLLFAILSIVSSSEAINYFKWAILLSYSWGKITFPATVPKIILKHNQCSSFLFRIFERLQNARHTRMSPNYKAGHGPTKSHLKMPLFFLLPLLLLDPDRAFPNFRGSVTVILCSSETSMDAWKDSKMAKFSVGFRSSS